MPDIHSLPSVTSAPLPSQPPTPLPPTPLPPTPLQSSQPSAPPLSSLKSPSIPVPAQSLPSFRHPSASGIGHHPGVHQGAWGAAEGSVGEPSSRALRLGVCGPVGTGKSSLIALLCAELSETLRMAVVTNDIYTDEDARFLRSAGVLDPERILAVETGACPHTAIRDDITANLMAVEDLEERFAPLDVVLVESGGDNLTATFSPALVDTQIFIIDVAGGGDVARKGGPGITRADLLIVNKTDLAPHVGVDPVAMVSDAAATRDGRPVIALSRHDRASVRELTDWVLARVREHRDGDLVPADPGPMAPHSHGAGPVHVHEPARLGGPGRVDYEHSSAHVHAHVQADVHADVPGRHVTDAESARVEHDHSSADVHADVPGRHVTDAESARVDNRSAHAPGAAPVPAPL